MLKNILEITCNLIDVHLPKRNVQDETYTTMVLDPSVDVREIIKEIKGDTKFESTDTGITESIDFEEDVEDIEDEILNEDTSDPLSFLTVSPAQLSTGIIQGGRVEIGVNSSSPVTVTIEYESGGNDWILANQSTLQGGNTDYRFKYLPTQEQIKVDDAPPPPRGTGMDYDPGPVTRTGGGGGGRISLSLAK